MRVWFEDVGLQRDDPLQPRNTDGFVIDQSDGARLVVPNNPKPKIISSALSSFLQSDPESVQDSFSSHCVDSNKR